MNYTNQQDIQPEYEDILSAHAEKTMSLVSLLGVPGLGWLTWGNMSIDPISGIAYLPALTVLLVVLITKTLSARQLDQAWYRTYADIYAGCCILGAGFVVVRAAHIDFPLTTSPLQFALLLTLPLCFRRRIHGLIRNIAFTLTALLSLALIDLSLLAQLQMHFVLGFFGGVIIQLIAEDRMYKDYLYRRSLYREQLNESQQLKRVGIALQNRCLPQQIERIKFGFDYDESLPTYPSNCWIFYLQTIALPSPEATAGGDEKQRLHSKFVSLYNKNLQRAYQVYQQRLGRSAQSDLTFDQGFLWKTNLEHSLTSYGYPFPLAEYKAENQTLLYAIMTQLQIHFHVAQSFPNHLRIGGICSLSYGQAQGAFVGSLNNYEIQGPAVELAACYLNARFHVSEVQEKISDGYYAIAIDPVSSERLRLDLERYFGSNTHRYEIKPHLRGSRTATEVTVVLIDPCHIERYLILFGQDRIGQLDAA